MNPLGTHWCLCKISWQSNSCQDISTNRCKTFWFSWKKKIRGSPRSLGFIPLGPWMSTPNFLLIHPKLVDNRCIISDGLQRKCQRKKLRCEIVKNIKHRMSAQNVKCHCESIKHRMTAQNVKCGAGCAAKVKGCPESVGVILWGPLMFPQHFMAIHLRAVNNISLKMKRPTSWLSYV